MSSTPHHRWYPRPAREWLEALPIGNGRLGAMVYGGTAVEELRLNEDTLWAGAPHDYDNPRARQALPEIRRLVFAGYWGAARRLVDADFLGVPASQAQFQTMGGIRLEFPGLDAVSDYRRRLNLAEALHTVEFTSGGVRHRREAFASAPRPGDRGAPDRRPPGSVSFTATFGGPLITGVSSPTPRRSSSPGGAGRGGWRRAGRGAVHRAGRGALPGRRGDVRGRRAAGDRRGRGDPADRRRHQLCGLALM
nr:glycoside hydrolase family 95 protein [Streptomyces sp. 8K308]